MEQPKILHHRHTWRRALDQVGQGAALPDKQRPPGAFAQGVVAIVPAVERRTFHTSVAYSMSLMDFIGRTRTVRDAGRAFCLTISPVNGFFTSLPPETAGFLTSVSFIKPR